MVAELLPSWAATGDVVAPDETKVNRGWTLGEKPPYEYMNWWQNLFAARVNEILKIGPAPWAPGTPYDIGALVSRNGVIYKATTANLNSGPPSASWMQVSENASALTTGKVAKERIAATLDPTIFVRTSTASAIVAERTNSNANASMEFRTTTGSVWAGQSAGGAFAVSSNPVLSGDGKGTFFEASPNGNVNWSGTAYGNGFGISNLDASKIATGTLPNGRLSGSYTGINNLSISGTFTGIGSGITNINANNITAGTVSNSRMNGDYSFNNLSLSGTITGNGSGLTDLDASKVARGTLSDARLPSVMSAKKFTGGINFDRVWASAHDDLTKHISLHWDGYGFGVTAGRLNYNAPPSATHRFMIGGETKGYVDADGFSGPGGNIIDLNASNIGSGTLPNARLAGNYSFGGLSLTGELRTGGNAFLNAVLAAPGTSARPSYAIEGDPDTGWNRSSADTVDIVAGGTARLRISTSEIATVGGAKFSGDGTGLSAIDASSLTVGTVPATRLPATTSGSNWVGGRIAAIGTSGIGMTVLAQRINNNRVEYGAVVDGSTLRPTQVSGRYLGSALPGQWMCLGFISGEDTDPNDRTTQFVRVS